MTEEGNEKAAAKRQVISQPGTRSANNIYYRDLLNRNLNLILEPGIYIIFRLLESGEISSFKDFNDYDKLSYRVYRVA